MTTHDTPEAVHMQQSVNGCVTCERKWYQHTPAERGEVVRSAGATDRPGGQRPHAQASEAPGYACQHEAAVGLSAPKDVPALPTTHDTPEAVLATAVRAVPPPSSGTRGATEYAHDILAALPPDWTLVPRVATADWTGSTKRADSEVARLRAAIQAVLDDAESQHPGGWGPDVTTVGILRAALDQAVLHPGGEEGRNGEEAEARMDGRAQGVDYERARIAEAVRGLAGHQVTGYEWECGTCAYDVKAGINRAPDGSPCPVDAFEDEAISRAAVLAIIEGETP